VNVPAATEAIIPHPGLQDKPAANSHNQNDAESLAERREQQRALVTSCSCSRSWSSSGSRWRCD